MLIFALDTTFMFHAAWCSRVASDYMAKVSGDQSEFTKNVCFQSAATCTSTQDENHTDVLWPLQFAPHPGEPEVATSPNLQGYTAQKAVCHSKLHNPGKHNPTTRMTLPG